MKKLLSTITIALILTACGTNDSKEEVKDNELIATISLIKEDETFHEQEVTFNEGETLKEIMEEQMNVVFDGNFVTEIEEANQDPETNTWWVFEVNGESSMVGAHEFEPKNNDEIDWELVTFE